MNGELIVTVELDDVLDAHHGGWCGDPLDCPVGRALARQYPGAIYIVSDAKVFTFIEGKPGPVYDLPQGAQEALAVFDAYTAGDNCQAHASALAAEVTVVLEPAPREFVPYMRRDKWKSVHNSKN